MKSLDAGPESNVDNHLYLDEFRPYRDCLIWSFNRLFWRYLGDWENASGKGFEAALPGGSSDANHPQAVSDSVADFWTLLRDLETRGQLPAEIVGLEIGVGSGARAAAWLDRFKALDEQCGTNFYSRLHFILGDYSPTSLERALRPSRITASTSAASRSTRSTRTSRSPRIASRSCTCTSPTCTTTCRSTISFAATASCTSSRCARI